MKRLATHAAALVVGASLAAGTVALAGTTRAPQPVALAPAQLTKRLDAIDADVRTTRVAPVGQAALPPSGGYLGLLHADLAGSMSTLPARPAVSNELERICRALKATSC